MFGGTSVGSSKRNKEVANMFTDGERKIVLFTALYGTPQT